MEKENRRSACTSFGEQESEIGVGCDDDPVLKRSPFKDHGIIRRRQPIVPYMDGIVALAAECLRHTWRDRVVDEKSHALLRGSMRSLTASAA